MALTRHCPRCAGDRRFEQIACTDGHGTGCPEWACVQCGTAILMVPEAPLTARAA